jgi:hypothetical protein
MSGSAAAHGTPPASQQRRPTPAARSPFDHASIFSRIAFSYVNPLLRLGNSRPLQAEDLPDLSKQDDTNALVERLSVEWETRKDAAHRDESRTLALALVAAFRPDFIISAILSLLVSSSYIGQPVLLRLFINWLGDDGASTRYGVGMGLGLAALAFAQGVLHHALYFQTMRLGWRIRNSVTGLLHKKLLNLGTAITRSEATGNIMNLISTDVLRFENFMPAVHYAWSSPLDVIVITALLCLQVRSKR